jgi:hypothetical protein
MKGIKKKHKDIMSLSNTRKFEQVLKTVDSEATYNHHYIRMIGVVCGNPSHMISIKYTSLH